MISIDGFEYNRQCRSDCEMSLLEKLRQSYNDRYHDPRASAMSDRIGIAFFWLITVSEIYVAVQYVVPQQFAQCSEWTRYCIKVFCWFLFVQTIANWACIRHCDTSYRVSADQPKLHVTFKHSSRMLVPKAQENGLNNPCRNIKQQQDEQFEGGLTDFSKSTDTNDSPIRWRWCKLCQHVQPPRCHHCVICRQCILKRDHHCYMTGVCIGLTNQRHFVVMNLYIAIASVGGFYFIAEYLADDFVPHAELSDYVLPVTLYRWAFSGGWIQMHHVLMLLHLYTLWWTGLCAVGFFIWHIAVISVGKTTHEVWTGAKLRCTATVAENFRSVFGVLWLLNFVFPAHIAFKQMSDGIQWTDIKKSTVCTKWQHSV